jgi:hypothetical protein
MFSKLSKHCELILKFGRRATTIQLCSWSPVLSKGLAHVAEAYRNILEHRGRFAARSPQHAEEKEQIPLNDAPRIRGDVADLDPLSDKDSLFGLTRRLLDL